MNWGGRRKDRFVGFGGRGREGVLWFRCYYLVEIGLEGVNFIIDFISLF